MKRRAPRPPRLTDSACPCPELQLLSDMRTVESGRATDSAIASHIPMEWSISPTAPIRLLKQHITISAHSYRRPLLKENV